MQIEIILIEKLEQGIIRYESIIFDFAKIEFIIIHEQKEIVNDLTRIDGVNDE
jgi:hypothetical protein